MVEPTGSLRQSNAVAELFKKVKSSVDPSWTGDQKILGLISKIKECLVSRDRQSFERGLQQSFFVKGRLVRSFSKMEDLCFFVKDALINTLQNLSQKGFESLKMELKSFEYPSNFSFIFDAALVEMEKMKEFIYISERFACLDDLKDEKKIDLSTKKVVMKLSKRFPYQVLLSHILSLKKCYTKALSLTVLMDFLISKKHFKEAFEVLKAIKHPVAKDAAFVSLVFHLVLKRRSQFLEEVRKVITPFHREYSEYQEMVTNLAESIKNSSLKEKFIDHCLCKV